MSGNQYYKDIPLRFINHRRNKKRFYKRFFINNHRYHYIWIPTKYLNSNGSILNDVDLDCLFNTRAVRLKLLKAGVDVNAVYQFNCIKLSRVI